MIDRSTVGRFGEAIAARFLEARGGEVVGRNVRIGHKEADLLVTMGAQRLLVEVKTAMASPGCDPIDSIGEDKLGFLRSLGRTLGATRIDYVGVKIGAEGVIVRWVPSIA